VFGIKYAETRYLITKKNLVNFWYILICHAY